MTADERARVIRDALADLGAARLQGQHGDAVLQRLDRLGALDDDFRITREARELAALADDPRGVGDGLGA